MAEEEPVEIGFPMVAAYHGQSALAMAAIVFQAQRAAFAVLSPETIPARRDISIVSGHPGPGVRDAFEFVTRAVTRGAYSVDRTLLDARFVPGHDISYSFRISVGERTVEMALLPGVLPERFFESRLHQGSHHSTRARAERIEAVHRRGCSGEETRRSLHHACELIDEAGTCSQLRL
ncbi:hypothetical protein ACVOMS_06225 [Bradyrhizobium guangxiense]